jgi:uncharacterized protein YlxW (UPF0749 family)
MVKRPPRSATVNISIIIASVVLGFLLTVQFRSTAARLPVRDQGRLTTADAVTRLEDEQHQLKERIAELRAQIDTLQRTSDTTASSRGVAANLDQQKLQAGLVALHGSGILVTLDDSTRTVGPTEDANNFIIHDYELRDVVSLLWLAGGEAIAINGERLINVSSLYCVGSTVLVNETRLSPPYEIRAIGDPAALDQALQNPKNLAKLRSRVKANGIQFKIVTQKDLTVPAFGGNLNIRYSRPTMVPDMNEDRKNRGM